MNKSFYDAKVDKKELFGITNFFFDERILDYKGKNLIVVNQFIDGLYTTVIP